MCAVDSKPPTQQFDCVQMKHEGAAKVRESTATLTREQELRVWEERSQRLRQQQAARKAAAAAKVIHA